MQTDWARTKDPPQPPQPRSLFWPCAWKGRKIDCRDSYNPGSTPDCPPTKCGGGAGSMPGSPVSLWEIESEKRREHILLNDRSCQHQTPPPTRTSLPWIPPSKGATGEDVNACEVFCLKSYTFAFGRSFLFDPFIYLTKNWKHPTLKRSESSTEFCDNLCALLSINPKRGWSHIYTFIRLHPFSVFTTTSVFLLTQKNRLKKNTQYLMARLLQLPGTFPEPITTSLQVNYSDIFCILEFIQLSNFCKVLLSFAQ